ncbi:MAG: family 16 glycoside hydrolase [Planctomycetota bacterium]
MLFLTGALFLPAATPGQDAGDSKKIYFMAGPRSHGYGAHEHYAGCMLLANALAESNPHYEIVVYQDGWPGDPTAFEGADTIVMYCDGGGGHPVAEHLAQVEALSAEGVGVVCIHYGVEVVKGEPGERFLDWIGGYFEAHWSVNPHWKAEFLELPEHPITRGVAPFAIQDEWYYHMRFREDMQGVTPILTAIPPASTLEREDGSHSGNPDVRAKAGQGQHLAWASERAGGGRGFGFTGGHFHWNWGNDNFRTLMLNAILWTAHAEVPEEGVPSRRPTLLDLQRNQDGPAPDDFGGDTIRERLDLPADSQQAGWIRLFNGRNLEGWRVKIAGHELDDNWGNTFRVENGLLRVVYDEYEEFDGKFGHLFFDTPFSHYRLRVEYRFVGEQCTGGPGWAFRNSGVMLHCQSPQSMLVDQDFPASIEAQMLGGNGSQERSTANLCTPGTNVVMQGELVRRHCTNSTSKTYHGDQWVTLELEVRGNQVIRHLMEGEVVLEYRKPQLDENDGDAQRLLAGGADKLLSGGYISLQAESHPLEFRKVELLPLEE